MSISEPPQILTSRLDPGEHLIWWDRPRQGIYLKKNDAYLIPFSLMWGGFAIFWQATVGSVADAPWTLQLWGIPFVAIGLYVIVGRFFHDAWRRERLAYGLTDRRVLIAAPSNCRSLAIDSLGEINLEEFANGKGSIALGPEPYPGGHGQSWGVWIGTPPVPTLEHIPDARRVFAAIHEAQRATRQP